ncbi:RagB/SusD family nutrient uptake outer membrane protein [Pedobacter nyackensis]|uniref:RagB/SusD family nutrient uptake outer membrane protein n=1 Tax=Pedobacter nyackensis TaxID=475255 RepID=UPI0029315975|nr:RagB/SusD family nutrient uptake outer membrane protein [Pedobacter nyackensis]
MKKLRYITLITLCLTSLCSCKKFLERDSPTATTDDKFWKLESDLRGNLDAVYGGMPSGTLNYSWHSNSFMHLEGTSDNLVFKTDFLSDATNIPLGLTTSSTGIYEQYYQKSYNYIRIASRFLEHYSTAYVEDLKIKERYAAEAKALRAWYHLRLWLLYGPVPIVDHSLTANEATKARATQAEIVKFIGDELLAAIPNLPDSYTENDNYRLSRGFCYTALSILYLNAKDYVKAAEYAKIVITDKDKFGYDLHKATDPKVNSYADLFTYNGVTSKERILYKKNANNEAFFRQAPRSLGGKAVGSPTASLVNSYETRQGKTIQELGADSLTIYTKQPTYHNNRDPRLSTSILVPDETFINRTFQPFIQSTSNVDRVGQTQSTQTGYLTKKYVDPSDVSRPYSGSLGFFIIRYAEVILTYVEALIEKGDYNNPDVITYINMIRNRAGMPNVTATQYNTQEKLRELLRRERRVEFALEGTRLYDIRRWKIAEQVMNGAVYGAYNPETQSLYLSETRIFKANRDYVWPIPLKELNSNPNMVQSDNW